MELSTEDRKTITRIYRASHRNNDFLLEVIKVATECLEKNMKEDFKWILGKKIYTIWASSDVSNSQFLKK